MLSNSGKATAIKFHHRRPEKRPKNAGSARFLMAFNNKFSTRGRMDPSRISHIVASPATTCMNIKSRRSPKQKCSNPATHGIYCGLHFKHPRPWSPPVTTIDSTAVLRIQRWFRMWRPIVHIRRHGIAYYDRTLTTNDCDFFSTDAMSDISGTYFFSYVDTDRHVYGFDVRSIHTLVQRARTSDGEPTNPFTRQAIPSPVIQKIAALVAHLQKQGKDTEWEPIAPPTPEQQLRMKIVDLFAKIDELGYYSSPDWFIGLNRQQQKRLYLEFYNIWTSRAELSAVQKNTIVPDYLTKLFRHSPWSLSEHTLESIQKINMHVIRLLISSAADRNDRILGAMYVIGALTVVHEGARTAYPWLHESLGSSTIMESDVGSTGGRFSLRSLLGPSWLEELLALREPLPVLSLPPQLMM